MRIYTSFYQLPLTLRVEEVAQILSISRAGAYQLFHRADFPCVKLGKRMFVERDKLLAWLDDQVQGKAEKSLHGDLQ